MPPPPNVRPFGGGPPSRYNTAQQEQVLDHELAMPPSLPDLEPVQGQEQQDGGVEKVMDKIRTVGLAASAAEAMWHAREQAKVRERFNMMARQAQELRQKEEEETAAGWGARAEERSEGDDQGAPAHSRQAEVMKSRTPRQSLGQPGQMSGLAGGMSPPVTVAAESIPEGVWPFAWYIDRVIHPHTGESLARFGMRLYVEAAGTWLERGAAVAVRRGPKGSGLVMVTLHDESEVTVLATKLAPDPLKENDGIMVETAFVRRSPEGKLTFAAYVAAVRETVETEGSPECPMLLTVYGIEAAMGDGAVFGEARGGRGRFKAAGLASMMGGGMGEDMPDIASAMGGMAIAGSAVGMAAGMMRDGDDGKLGSEDGSYSSSDESSSEDGSSDGEDSSSDSSDDDSSSSSEDGDSSSGEDESSSEEEEEDSSEEEEEEDEEESSSEEEDDDEEDDDEEEEDEDEEEEDEDEEDEEEHKDKKK